jgi:hypothetical protein
MRLREPGTADGSARHGHRFRCERSTRRFAGQQSYRHGDATPRSLRPKVRRRLPRSEPTISRDCTADRDRGRPAYAYTSRTRQQVFRNSRSDVRSADDDDCDDDDRDGDELLPLHSMQTRIAMLFQRRVYACTNILRFPSKGICRCTRRDGEPLTRTIERRRRKRGMVSDDACLRSHRWPKYGIDAAGFT